MASLSAIIWDVDGTLAETERDGHRVAFNRAFEDLGLAWRWDEALYGRLLAVAGGFERLLHFFSVVSDAPRSTAEREDLARALHRCKNEHYAALVGSGSIALRPGVRELMHEARSRGLRMGIATTTSRSNVDALLATQIGGRWRDEFAAVVCGEDVAAKKPDPEVYVRALRELRLQPHDALAIEDSPDGARAASAAGIPVIVTRGAYFQHASVPGAAAAGPGLHHRGGWEPAPTSHADPEAPIRLHEVERWWRIARQGPAKDRSRIDT